MENKIYCCNCVYWSKTDEDCTISEVWEYDKDEFCKLCPQYQEE